MVAPYLSQIELGSRQKTPGSMHPNSHIPQSATLHVIPCCTPMHPACSAPLQLPLSPCHPVQPSASIPPRGDLRNDQGPALGIHLTPTAPTPPPSLPFPTPFHCAPPSHLLLPAPLAQIGSTHQAPPKLQARAAAHPRQSSATPPKKAGSPRSLAVWNALNLPSFRPAGE